MVSTFCKTKNRLSHYDDSKDTQKALTTPPGEKPDRKIKGPDGKVYSSETEMCRAYGADPKLYAARIAYGCPMEKALTMEKQEQGFPKKPQKGPNGKMYASKTDRYVQSLRRIMECIQLNQEQVSPDFSREIPALDLIVKGWLSVKAVSNKYLLKQKD